MIPSVPRHESDQLKLAPALSPEDGFQLWVALPPELENASASHYVMPDGVPVEGPTAMEIPVGVTSE